MRRRTLGRELVLKYLFTIELGTEKGMESFTSFAADQEKDAQVRAFAEGLARGVIENRDALRRAVEAEAEHWQWKRMPIVDRAILLMGAYEILHVEDVPSTVTINEVVELAKKFSTKASGAFVNGVLDALVQHQPGPDAKKGTDKPRPGTPSHES